MAVNNFVFMENWVGSQVTGVKIAFLPILTQPGTTLWFQKAQIWNSINWMLIFNRLERQKLYYNQLCDFYDWLTKVKTLKIIAFCHFWPKPWKNLVLISFKSLKYFYHHYFLLLNKFLIQNMKKPIDNARFFDFSKNGGIIGPTFYLWDHSHIVYFLLIPYKIFYSSNINNLCCNSCFNISEKKLARPLKQASFF